MKTILFKLKNTLILIFLFFISVVIISYYSQVNSATIKNSGYYNNPVHNILFTYPEGWFVQERGNSELTPFAVLLSNIDLDNYHPLPGEYPDQFVNIVFYKTNQTEDEYALGDLSAKKIKNLKKDDFVIDGQNLHKYKGDFKKGKYWSVYKRNGEYLVIIESYLENFDKEKEIDKIFSDIVRSLKVNEKITKENNLLRYVVRRSGQLLLRTLSIQNIYAAGNLVLPFYESHSINAYMDLDDRFDWVFDYEHRTSWQESVTGWRLGYAYDGHNGTDYNLSTGAKVAAADAGTVVNVVDNQPNTYPSDPTNAGNRVSIDHSDGYRTKYFHLETGSLFVGLNENAQQGRYIAKSDNSGYSTGPPSAFRSEKDFRQ